MKDIKAASASGVVTVRPVDAPGAAGDAMLRPSNRPATKVDPRQARAAINLPKFLLLAAQLGALLLVFHIFSVDSERFFRLAVCAFSGFAIHYFTPFAWKKWMFVALSFLGGFLILGEFETHTTRLEVLQAGGLVAICLIIAFGLGAAFYISLRLPIPFYARLAPVFAIACALLWARHTGALDGTLFKLPFYWKVIGAIFMFRLIIYAYDVRTAKTPERFSDFCSYFFLMPNFCYFLFPVIDYTTFKKGYYVRDIHASAQRGVGWIARGTIHLCLYRIINHNLIIQADDVTSFGTLVQYLITPFWLYLQVSGWFHIIIGMMHLFGWTLPETNNNYFLASSFTDFWRRINIYWKDFMVKVFYYPVYFRMKKTPKLALIVATAVVFIATTLLHSYQYFWLNGYWSLTAADGLFWGILGVLVMGSVLYEAQKTPAAKQAKAQASPVAALAKRSLATLAVYLTISVLWSLWSSQSPQQWFEAVTYWRNTP